MEVELVNSGPVTILLGQFKEYLIVYKIYFY